MHCYLTLHLFLQDLQALDPDTLCSLLQPLFRSKSILKIGYALGGDLSAVARALGPRGTACTAVLSAVIDIGALHRALRQLHTLRVKPSPGDGLSGLVHAQLGAPIDKAEQCSAWGRRPLSAAQLRYAATDAACLLALLDELIACASEHLASHCGRDSDRHGPTDSEDVSSRVSPAEPPLQEKTFSPLITNDSDSAKGINSSGDQPQQFQWTVEQLRAAAAAWGQRWERVGKTTKRTGGLMVHDHSITKTKAKASSGRRSATGGSAGFNSKLATFLPAGKLPLHVPFMESSGRFVSTPRFLADVMVLGLARQLRLWGFDAEAVDTVPKNQRHLVHRSLVERSQAEGRVILTRDTIFIQRGLSDQAYFVVSEAKKEQLEEVVAAFKLPVERETLLTRCARCNGEFLPESVSGDALPAGHGVPAGVVERVPEFWVCCRCGAAYWQGSMYDRAMERLTADLEGMALGQKSGANGSTCAQKIG